MISVSDIANRVAQPPPDLNVAQWADEYRVLSREASAEPGRWRCDRAPYQIGIMEAFTDNSIHTIVVMSSAQVGKTEMLLNVIGYHIHQDPSPILLLQPTLEMAETFSKDRLAPMVRDTPALTGTIKDPRSRDSGNTLLHKQFPGGHITMAGANSPSSLASRPIRIVLCDEVDRYPASAGTEGDPVNLARKRTATFWNRKVMLTSTPTIKGVSRIESAYEASDKRRYWVPCPHCGEYQTLKWSMVRWDEGQPETARYFCEHCGEHIEERHKPAMLKAGEWRAEAESRGVAGFHLSELYSPWRKWSEVASDFLEAHKGGQEMLKTWVNTALGEPWEEQGEGVEPVGLMARLEDYPDDLPLAFTTAGVDVQNNRLEVSVVGWGVGEEAWLLDHIILDGDTARPDVWEDLHDTLTDAGVAYAAIDSGYNTSMVYAFTEKRAWTIAIKGVSGSRPLIEDERRRRQRMRVRKRKGAPVEPLGVDQGKSLIYSRLKMPDPGPGYIHFKRDVAFDDEYFAQLTAEQLVRRYKKGVPYLVWESKRDRNEALDCLVYALAAARLSGKAMIVTHKAIAGDKGPQTGTTIRGRRARYYIQR